jgi:tRNA (cmo5U34)-methyltransferase
MSTPTIDGVLNNALSALADDVKKNGDQDKWTCPTCNTVVFGNDAKNRYCPNCHKFYPLPDGTFADDKKEKKTTDSTSVGLVDHTLPKGGQRWTFDGDVTRVFDNMLERSIPQYFDMRNLVYQIGREYVQRDTAIVDLGCSRGEALAPFVQHFGVYNTYLGVDVSDPMLAAARERFADMIKTGSVRIQHHDLRTGYPSARASVTLAVLTLQFVPMEYRFQLLADIYAHTLPGGCLILVEKVLGATALLDAQLVRRYHALKLAHGYTQEEIDRKRLSLEGVLVPMPASWNMEMLRFAGFDQIDCFWRQLNFAGFIAVRKDDRVTRAPYRTSNIGPPSE